MIFEPKYPDVVFVGPIVASLIVLFNDEEFVSGALYWSANGVTESAPVQPDEPVVLPVFARVGDSLVWREQEAMPGLLITAKTQAIEDDDQQLDETHVISIDLILSRPSTAGEDEVIGQHAYWYGKAVDMMLRSIPDSVLFANTNIEGRGKLQVKQHDYGVTGQDKGAYMRYPLITAEIRVLEGL